MKYIYIFFLVCSLVKFVIFMFKMLNLLWHNFDFNQFLVATWFWMLLVWEPFHKSHFGTHGSKSAMLVKICYTCFLMTLRCWKLISFLMLNLMFDLDNLRILWNDFVFILKHTKKFGGTTWKGDREILQISYQLDDRNIEIFY